MLAQALHVGDEMPGGVVLDRRVGRGAAAAALVEENDAVVPRIVEAAHGGVAAAARTAVDDQNRSTARVAALGVIKIVTVTRLDAAFAIGVYGSIESVTLTNGHGPEYLPFLRGARCRRREWTASYVVPRWFFCRRWNRISRS